ncbi:MAG: exodeoxyribonuclease I [Gammaproteobacteria bacterium]|nr:MAG: exodeoxyribonuclease I [Gammaproteobacteria bacterium]
MPTPSFYWFDYETFGLDPAWDRPAQFAGLRTDLDLKVVGEPRVLYNRLTDDYLPDPGAAAITGITPSTVNQEGLREVEFIRQVRAELGAPGTCSLGYNTIGFDDHFTRYTLYRNFFDPYEHEWANGNSRWDLLDIVRLTRALRPEGIAWPTRDDGSPNNKLEHLSAANGILHAQAHDALSDVHATIGMARLIREHQPRLFDYAFAHRGRQAVAEKLNVQRREPQILVSSRIPAARSHLAVVLPLMLHPGDAKKVWLFDLAHDPEALLATPPGEIEKPSQHGLVSVRTNQCPVMVPMSVLRDADAERLGIDRAALERHLAAAGVLDTAGFLPELASHLDTPVVDGPRDADGSLYGGGFFGDEDRRRIHHVHAVASPEALRELEGQFLDARLNEMLWRYRARNWPESLDHDEQARWQDFCRDRLLDTKAPWRDYASFMASLATTDFGAREDSLRPAFEQLAHDAAVRLGLPTD